MPGPKVGSEKYVGYLKPIGYPETSSICGLCDNPGVIWIEKEGETSYMENGQRIFDGPNTFTKMKADDSGVHKRTIL